tara:strand:+ start:6719 stop:7750 length:1032 start_codon:yes stop_codon:yes gene_type:complete
MELKINELIKNKPFIIAEISANHKQDISLAKKLIDLASECGSNAVKFQTFRPDSLTLNSNSKEFVLNEDSNWSGYSLYQLYEQAATPFEWHEELFEYSKSKDLIPFTSVFSIEDIDFLESINCAIYKIASYEANDIQLVDAVSKLNKPVIMSVGGCTEAEVQKSINILKENLLDNFVVLNCLSAYPAPLNEFSIGRTSRLINEFNVITGLSDHSSNNSAALATLSLGGLVFEKHIMIDEEDSLDKDFSATKDEFQHYVSSLNDLFTALKEDSFEPKESEAPNVILKRSIFTTKKIKKGETFTLNNTRSVRPSSGLHPHLYKNLLGSKSLKDLEENSPISEEDF